MSSAPEPEPVGPGQESVWDYPRPPRIEPTERLLRVTFGGQVMAETRGGLRVLETASPPTLYFPPEDVRTDLLLPADHQTVCEWKGVAEHFDLTVDDKVSRRAAWSYPTPRLGYEKLAGYVAFYPARVDEATVDGELVRAQAGGYYGGWITSEIVGPFKGDPGTVDCEAIVNAANSQLWMGGGVAGAIKRAAGSIVEQEAMAQGPIRPGEAVATSAGNLPRRYMTSFWPRWACRPQTRAALSLTGPHVGSAYDGKVLKLVGDAARHA